MRKKTPRNRDVRMVLDLQLDPFLVRWGAFAVTWNSVCTTLALIVGTLLTLRSMERRGVERSVAGRIACLLVLGGFVGSRAVRVLVHATYYAAVPRDLFLLGDGTGSIVGALLGGGLVVLSAARMFAVPHAVLLNAVVPSVLLSFPLHAIGNLLTGAGWGPPTSGSWGVIYWHPHALVPPDLISVPLHPLPLYQMVISFACFMLWAMLGRRRPMFVWRVEQEVR
jgi:phosphatidylglycerol:prolipoprotein diacylglycerol transferase